MKLTEAKKVYYGDFINSTTFVDPQGNRMTLEKTDLEDLETEMEGEGQSSSSMPNKSSSQGRKSSRGSSQDGDSEGQGEGSGDPPEEVPPNLDAKYLDIRTGIYYKWNGSEFEEVLE